jgi:hypothetical protein
LLLAAQSGESGADATSVKRGQWTKLGLRVAMIAPLPAVLPTIVISLPLAVASS